jgi:hypothetical protein
VENFCIENPTVTATSSTCSQHVRNQAKESKFMKTVKLNFEQTRSFAGFKLLMMVDFPLLSSPTQITFASCFDLKIPISVRNSYKIPSLWLLGKKICNRQAFFVT